MLDLQLDKDARAEGNWQGANWIRREKRLAIYMRDGMTCVYCGTSAKDLDSPLALDHIKPHSQGGTNDASNLVTSCRPCNSIRGIASVKTHITNIARSKGHNALDIEKHIQDTRHKMVNVTLAKDILRNRSSWEDALAQPKKTLQKLILSRIWR